MNKRIHVVAGGFFLLVMFAASDAARADITVSGEAKAYSSATARLQVNVEARSEDGQASGAVHYTRMTPGGSPELELDMSVSCMWASADSQRVVLAGPASVTSNPRSAAVDEWFVVAVQKKPAEKDRVRALFATEREAAAKCASGETTFPAIVDSGGFEVTQDGTAQSNLFGTGRDVNIDPDRVGGSRDLPLPVPDLTIGETEKNIGRNISRCTAHFRFNGNLEDASGNGHDAMMVDLNKLPTGGPAKFEEGKLGQALRLTGDAVAVAPLDLHFEACPKITITAWVHLLSEPSQQMEIVSTGYGSGPRLAVTKSNASAWGGANEIRTRSRDWLPEIGVWFPIVAVWDYEAGTHSFYTRVADTAITEQLGDYSREPQQDLWIGAYAYGSSLMSVAADILIDDLRVYDRILDSSEITAALDGTQPIGSDCNCETSAPGQIPLSGTLPSQRAGLGESELQQQVGDHDFSGNTHVINPGSVPTSPTDTLSSDSSGGLLESPTIVDDPGADLIAPDDLPGDVLERDLETVEAGKEEKLEEMNEERINEGENAFGLKNRTQVVIGTITNAAGVDVDHLAYAGWGATLLVGPGGLEVSMPKVEIETPSIPVGQPISGLPPLPGEATNAGGQLAGANAIAEVFRIHGSDGYMIVNASGMTKVIGNTHNKHLPVNSAINSIVRRGRPVDLVASSNNGYLLISGTNVHEKNAPPSAVSWAEKELADLQQITAFTFLPGGGWIGVSNREVKGGGMSRSHWGLDLLTDVRRLVADGEQVHDISATSDSATVGSWAIATDRQVYFRQEPKGRFPQCRAYMQDEIVYHDGQSAKATHQFGEKIENEIDRTFSCWYPEPNCLVKYPTWSERDMSSPADPNTWLVNLLITVGVQNYTGIDKQILDCALDDRIRKAEEAFAHGPALKFRVRIVRRTEINGVGLSEYIMDSGSDHGQFMDANFDVMAKSKTEGYYPILVTDRICVGYKDGDRKCAIGGRATFPHWVSPTTRKHGIIMKANSKETTLAHEFGHYLGLKHTFEPYVNLEGDLNCNSRFAPKGGGVTCNSCTGSKDLDDARCSGPYNIMDYCSGAVEDANLNFCQQGRAVSQRNRYLTNAGQTNYAKMKGRLGEPYCKVDSDCLDEEYCNTGVFTVGRNACKSKLDTGAACSRSGQCDSGNCLLLICRE